MSDEDIGSSGHEDDPLRGFRFLGDLQERIAENPAKEERQQEIPPAVRTSSTPSRAAKSTTHIPLTRSATKETPTNHVSLPYVNRRKPKSTVARKILHKVTIWLMKQI